jgi:hypothetical protein
LVTKYAEGDFWVHTQMVYQGFLDNGHFVDFLYDGDSALNSGASRYHSPLCSSCTSTSAFLLIHLLCILETSVMARYP